MDVHTATELAYKNGYEKGYADGKADAVKHGRWILGKVEPGYCTPGGNRPWICSECGNVQSWRLDRPTENYCPNCGAKMDG
jgi:rubrerythrin